MASDDTLVIHEIYASVQGETSFVGPIRGVRSRVSRESTKVFLDQTNTSLWEFRSDVFARFRTAPSELGIPRWNALTIGRPFRYPLPGGLPGNGGAGGPGPRPPGGNPPGGPRQNPPGGSGTGTRGSGR